MCSGEILRLGPDASPGGAQRGTWGVGSRPCGAATGGNAPRGPPSAGNASYTRQIRQGSWVGPAARRPRSLPPMSVDFAAEGLLDGLEGDARAARERLLERLTDQGTPLDELKRAVEEDRLVLLPAEPSRPGEGTRLVLLPAERLIGGEARYTGAEIAERTGLDEDFLFKMRRAHGLPVPEPDAVAFTEADLEATWIAKTFHDAGVK